MIRPLIPLACILVATLPLSAEDAVFEYDFSLVDPGPLVGQDGWSDYNPGPDARAVSPIVETSSDAPAIFVGQTESGHNLLSRGRKQVRIPELSGVESFALEFDLCAESERPIAMMGLGNNAAFPPTVGFMFDTMVIREVNFDGRIHKAFGPDGKPLRLNPGDWYTVRSVWTYVPGLEAWTATLAMRNLTLEEQEFTPVFFDVEQKQKSVPLGIHDAPKVGDFWNTLVLRTGTPNGKIANFRLFRLDP